MFDAASMSALLSGVEVKEQQVWCSRFARLTREAVAIATPAAHLTTNRRPST